MNSKWISERSGKKAGEARDVLAEFRETVKNEKKLKEIDELAEHLDEAAEISNIERGRLQGQKIGAKGIEKAKSFLQKRGVDLRVAPANGAFKVEGYFNRAGNVVLLEAHNAAMFITDGKKMSLIIREEATVLELLHELMHYRHCEKLGKLKYYNLTKASISEGTLIRERYVFDKLMEHRKYLNQNELIDAKDYMNYHYNKHGITDKLGNPIRVDFDFDISKITNRKQEISIDKILNLK